MSMGTEAEETVGEETVELLHLLYLPVVTQAADELGAATLSDTMDTAVIESTSGDEESTVLEIGAEVELLHRLYLPVVTQ